MKVAKGDNYFGCFRVRTRSIAVKKAGLDIRSLKTGRDEGKNEVAVQAICKWEKRELSKNRNKQSGK